MAETVQLTVQPRDGAGTRASERLRQQGLLPAVVYGHKEATVPVALSHDDFVKALRHGARLVQLKTNGSTESAIIQEVQWDHLGKEVLHVDFTRVSKDERIGDLVDERDYWRDAAIAGKITLPDFEEWYLRRHPPQHR